MVDDVKNNAETTLTKVGEIDPAERARLVRERRESEQRRRLDELRAHAAAAHQQRVAREEERLRRAELARVKDEERRAQVEERKRAIWESTVERRTAMAERDRERAARVEAARAARTPTRTPFAFGSSTSRLLEPADTGGMLWAHRRAASTSNVMMTSAPLTRRSSFYDLDRPDGRTDDKKEENAEKSPQVWSSVARRKTDLVPTMPAPRNNESGVRSGSSTPVSRPSSALSSTVTRRPASAPRRPRPTSFTPSITADENEPPQRRHRPVSMHLSMTTTPTSEGKPPLQRKPKLSKEQSTPKAGSESPGVERSSVERQAKPAKDIRKEKTKSDQVNATEVSQKLEALQIQNKSNENRNEKPALAPKPDLKKQVQKSPQKTVTETKKQEKAKGNGKSSQENVKSSQENVKTSQESVKTSQESVKTSQESVKNEIVKPVVVAVETNGETLKQVEVVKQAEDVKQTPNESLPKQVEPVAENVSVTKIEVTKFVEDLNPNTAFIENEKSNPNTAFIENERKQSEVANLGEVPEIAKLSADVKPVEIKISEGVKTVEIKLSGDVKPVEVKVDDKKVDKLEDVDMTASMMSRSIRISTEEQAKAALAERRKKAREEAEKRAKEELERLAREEEAEAERQRQEEEKQRQLEEEAKELAQLQRKMEEEKLRKAIEEQQAAAVKAEEERQRAEEEKARLEADKVRAEAERLKADAERRAELQREEDERRERRKRVEAIMARTRKKAEEESKQQEESERLQSEPTDITISAVENNNAPFENGATLNGNKVENVTTVEQNQDQSKQETLISFESGDDKQDDATLIDLSLPNPGNDSNKIGDELSQKIPIDSSNGFTIQNGRKDNKEFDVLNNGSHHPTLTNVI